MIYPRDGIADSQVEQFEIELDGETADAVIVRAMDAMNNVATAVATLRTPAPR